MAITATNPATTTRIQTTLANLLNCLKESSCGASNETKAERIVIDQRLQNFRLKDSRAYQFFEDRKWTELRVPEMVSIGQLFALAAELEMDREAKRRKEVLFRWMEDNWEACRPHAMELQLEFAPETA
jgi:hypothetical protein